MNQSQIKPLIVVGLALSDADQLIITQAVALSRRLNARLHFVHGVEPAAAAAWIETYYAADLAIELELLKSAESELALVKRNIASDIEVTTQAVLAPAASALCSEALAKRASFVLVGAYDKVPKFVPQGFSTALSTMAMSEVPVLALRHSLGIDLGKDDFRVMVADDLQSNSRRSVIKAFSLALELKAKSITHVHIVPPFPAEKSRIQLRDFFGTKWPDEGAEKFFKENFENSRAKFEKTMHERVAMKLPKLAEAGVKYHAVLKHGVVAEEMARIAADHKVNLAIFGHHRAVHARPLTLGKMPLRAMTEGNYATLVIP
jgi:nucleotide-binding universal stress UspA family protein